MNERPLLLIVEDDEALRDRLARAFEQRGFDVRTAGRRWRTLKPSSREETPELVVLDLRDAGTATAWI